jgi:hypothetical protein
MPFDKLKGLFLFILNIHAMDNKQNKTRHLMANSFIVNDENLDHESALSVCKILNAITSLNDEAIIKLFGTLDFNKIILKHFNIDIIGKAFLNDMVHFYSYATAYDSGRIEIQVQGEKQKGKKRIPIVNGSFVFAIKQGIVIQYSLS